MLQTIREKLTGWFAIIILGAIALTLVITFGNIDTGFTGASTAASVNGEDIPVSEFRAIYRQQRQEWETNFRAEVPEEVAVGMAESVVQSIVRNRAVAQHVRAQGYRINDDTVIDSIKGNGAFLVGGKFSQPAYEQLLRSQGLSQQRYEYEERQSMELAQFLEGVGYTAFYTPAEFRRYIALDGESRDVEYVLLTPSRWLDEVQITAEAIASRYELEQGRYQTEEFVALEFIEVNYENIAAEVDVTTTEVQQFYDENPQEFIGADERLASHILLAAIDDSDKEAAAGRAAEVLARLAAGEDFAVLASEFSDDLGTAGDGGSLGWLGRGDAPAEEFEAALFALEEGGLSEHVGTEFGYHIIRLDGLRQGANLEFAEVEDSLRRRLLDDIAVERFGDLVDELDERALESLDGLAPVAAAMGLKLGTVEEFTHNGSDVFGFVPELVDNIFTLEVLEDGENSPVIALDDNRAVVVRVSEHHPAVIKPLDEVEPLILAELKQEEAIALAAIEGAGLTERLNSDVAPAEVLKGSGATLQEASVRRGDPTLPADLSAAVFRAPKPELEPGSFKGLLLASGEFAIYRVVIVEAGKPDNFSLEDRDLRKDRLAGRLGGGQATAIIESLVGQALVTVSPDLIDNELGLR